MTENSSKQNHSLLEVVDLKKHFPLKKKLFRPAASCIYAVNGVSFHINQRESLGLVGESGCGKSTVALAVLRLIEPTAGKILFEGRDLCALNKKELQPIRKNMQIIFQDPYSSLSPRRTIAQILGEPLDIFYHLSKKEKADRIAYLLEKVSLKPEHAKLHPHQLSGGQRQRIGVARALALSPKLIVADEPVSALDVSIQAQIMNLLKDLQNEFNITYLIIAHDLAVVEHMCDRIAVMYLGKIVELASDKQLLLNPLHPYTEALLSSVPEVSAGTNRKGRILLEGDVPSPSQPPSGCSFHTRCRYSFNRCVKEPPVLSKAGGEHFVACHLRASRN